MFSTQLNAIVVQSHELDETPKGKPFIRLKCKSQLADSKGYCPTYILMVWNAELMEKVKELEIGSKIDAYCKCTIFLNKKNDAQDISFTLLDYVPSLGFKTSVDRTAVLQRVIITKITKQTSRDDKPYYFINGFSEQDNILCNFNISAFNSYVVERIEKMKLEEKKSVINCSARISPFKRERIVKNTRGLEEKKTYQDYSYVLLDLDFAEHKTKEEDEKKEEAKPYSPTEKEWKLEDFDIFKQKFMGNL